jgi:DNA-directed RNA polymerase specialized sigma24 family protein
LTRIALDAARCEWLVERGAAGDEVARRNLVEVLWPSLLDMVRSSRSMGPLARSEDHVHEVATRVVEKLVGRDGHVLRTYVPWRDRNHELTFVDWLRIVTKNAVRDYVREQVGPRRADADEPSLKRLLNEFASSAVLEEQGVRPPLTAAQTARELLEFARDRLPEPQVRVLAAWLEGASFEDIGAETGKTAGESRRLLRAAVATLRRQFGP